MTYGLCHFSGTMFNIMMKTFITLSSVYGKDEQDAGAFDLRMREKETANDTVEMKNRINVITALRHARPRGLRFG